MATSLSSSPVAQFLLGFLYASGFEGVEQDQSKAVLYYTLAAIQGLPEAQMALGYRHQKGIGVSKDCMQALNWYEQVANTCAYVISRQCSAMFLTVALIRVCHNYSLPTFHHWPTRWNDRPALTDAPVGFGRWPIRYRGICGQYRSPSQHGGNQGSSSSCGWRYIP